jgi:hypothetical protein
MTTGTARHRDLTAQGPVARGARTRRFAFVAGLLLMTLATGIARV